MKTVLITGANKSIGFETARQLLKQDYFVYLGSRDITKGQEAAEKLKAEGLTNVEPIEIDVTKPESIKTARRQLGTKTNSLDVLINNAGISGGIPKQALTTSADVVREVFEPNLFGVIEVTLAFMDLLRASDAPRIVNVSSGLASLTLHNDPSWNTTRLRVRLM